MHNGYIQLMGPGSSCWLLVLVTEHGCVLPVGVGRTLAVEQPLLCPNFCMVAASPCLLHLPLHCPLILWMGFDIERTTIVHVMYLTPILSSGWGSAGPASAPQQVCAECLSSCYSRCRHNSSPDSTDQTMTGTTPDHKENHNVLPWHMDLYLCRRHLMVQKTEHAPRVWWAQCCANISNDLRSYWQFGRQAV